MKIKLSRKEVARINKKNRAGKPWIQNEDHIIRCWDLYKQGRMTTRQLQDHFPGRTIAAISAKVWKIRGATPREVLENPQQEDLFRKLIK